MMRSNWWKFLGVAIILYTFIAGMLVPLKPGIVAVSPSSARTGEVLEMEIQGYNSNFKQGEASLRAWLKLDNERALGAIQLKAEDDQNLKLSFRIPEYLPVRERIKDMTLIVDNEIDGASFLPSAVFVTQDSIDPDRGVQVWENEAIVGLHEAAGITFPFRNILKETIRNTYFHVSLWFAMVIIFIGSVVQSVKYLRTNQVEADLKALSLTRVGLILGFLGLVTGAIWAKNTWGAYWSWDVKQNMTAIALLIYCAYFVLRSSFEDQEKSGRLGAVYNIFAFAALIPLIYVIPRLTDSLHPGAGGNPALGGEDLDNTMRMVFYPAVIGWTLLGLWMASLWYRADLLAHKLLDR
jgi:heme exporter protein C